MPCVAAPSCVVSEAPSTLPGEANTTIATALSEAIPRACTEFLLRVVPRNATITMIRAIAETPMPHLLRAVMSFSPLVPLGHRIGCFCDQQIPAIVYRALPHQQSFHHLQLGF